MYFEMPQQSANDAVVWPAEPNIARYAYIGDITGEENFRSAANDTANTLSSFLYILIGLDHSRRDPLVLQRPQSGITTPDGRIYVTDVSRQAVFVFDELLGTLDVWEQAGAGNTFSAPTGIASNTNGDIYIADSDQKIVHVMDHDGKYLGSWGSDILQRPTGLAYDSLSNRLYVADTAADDIKVFDNSGLLVDIIGSTGDQPGQLNAPTYLSFSHDQLYISDTLNARVQIFTRDGDFIRTVGKRGIYVGQFNRPKGVTVDSDGNIYAIESYYDHMIIFNRNGELLLTIGGAGKGTGKFFLPAGIWTDKKDRIYVADMLNGRIAVFQYLGNES